MNNRNNKTGYNSPFVLLIYGCRISKVVFEKKTVQWSYPPEIPHTAVTVRSRRHTSFWWVSVAYKRQFYLLTIPFTVKYVWPLMMMIFYQKFFCHLGNKIRSLQATRNIGWHYSLRQLFFFYGNSFKSNGILCLKSDTRDAKLITRIWRSRWASNTSSYDRDIFIGSSRFIWAIEISNSTKRQKAFHANTLLYSLTVHFSLYFVFARSLFEVDNNFSAVYWLTNQLLSKYSVVWWVHMIRPALYIHPFIL